MRVIHLQYQVLRCTLHAVVGGRAGLGWLTPNLMTGTAGRGEGAQVVESSRVVLQRHMPTKAAPVVMRQHRVGHYNVVASGGTRDPAWARRAPTTVYVRSAMAELLGGGQGVSVVDAVPGRGQRGCR